MATVWKKPIAIYYEHPDWFRPLFQQLDERGLPLAENRCAPP